MKETYLPSRTTCLWIAALMIGASFVAFGGALSHGFAMLDDSFLIVNNLAVRTISPSTIKAIFTTFDPELYIPFTFLSYQIDYVLGGGSPAMFHFTNVLLHGLNALLVAWLLLLLTKRRLPALFGGLLFAIHPLHTEAVVWIAGRKDLLSAFFFLLSFILFLRYRETENRKQYVTSIVFFLFSLLAKVMTITLPVLLLLTDTWREKRITKKMVMETVPYFALSVMFGLIGMFGKERVLSESTLMEKILMAGKSTVFYVQKLFVPTDLTVFYPYNAEIALTSAVFLVPLLLVAIITIVSIFSLRKTKAIAFGWLFFLIALSPTFINFKKGGDVYFASDRYAYLPSIGILFLVLWGASVLFERIETRRMREQAKKFAIGICAVVAIVFIALSIRQTNLWGDHESLYAHALKLYPQSVPARINLAVIYRETNRIEEESTVLQESRQYGESVKIFTALGEIEGRRGRVDEAKKLYEQAMALEPDNPEPHFFLGSLYDDLGRSADAFMEYKKAAELDPTYAAAFNNMGNISFARDQLKDAETYFAKAVDLNPNFMEALYNLSLAYERQEKRPEAFEMLKRAYRVNPSSVEIRFALAQYYMQDEEYEITLEILKSILRDDPRNMTARSLLQQMIDAGIVGMDR